MGFKNPWFYFEGWKINLSAFFYFLILAAGTILFLVRRCRLTVWWVAFYSGAIYGLPITVGWDIFGASISPIVGVIVLSTQFFLLLCCWFREDEQTVGPELGGEGGFLSFIATLVCVLSFVALMMSYGTSVFFVHKTESGIGGYFYILWRISSTYAVVISMIERRYHLAALASVPLVATIFAGDRTAVGLAAIGLLWMTLQTRRISGMKLGIALPSAALLGLFLFFGKTFQALWTTGGLSSASDLTTVLIEDGFDGITKTEPFVVIGVFSALTKLQVEPPGNLLLDVASQFLVVPSWFGIDSGSFNDFFQPLLFPGFKEKSLAYSFWGEAYVRGGWVGVVAFFLIYCAGLVMFDRLSRRQSLVTRSFAYVGGAYWAFYIHRNSLVSMIAYERQIVLFLLALVVVTLALRRFNRRLAP